MKALKHSLEHTTRQYRDDELIIPYGLRNDTHIHCVGYGANGERYEVHVGHGDETLYYELPQPTTEAAVRSKAHQAHNNFSASGSVKFRTDGTVHDGSEPVRRKNQQQQRPPVKNKKSDSNTTRKAARAEEE